MGSRKVLVSGVGWCYEVTAELNGKLAKKTKNNVTSDKNVRIFNQTKK